MSVEPRKYKNLDTRRRRNLTAAYIEDQKGCCWYCGETLDGNSPLQRVGVQISWEKFSPYFMNAPNHLHHDHETGLTVGVVHNYCNAVLFCYEGK